MQSACTKGGASRPTYVSLIHWTEQGIKNYKDTTSRAEDFTKLAESLGGRVRELLWTVGEYDVVVDFPDDERARRPCSCRGRWATSARTRCGPSTPRRWATSSGGPAKRGHATPGLWRQACGP